MKILLSVLTLLLTSILVNAQSNQIILNANINLPHDSIESGLLIDRINGFINSFDEPHEQNEFVLPNQKIETYILLDELYGIQKNKEFEDDQFYKPYLNNIISLPDEKYLIQLSYLGIHEDTPLQKASIELIAHKTDNTFYFSSPFVKNTEHWKSVEVNNITFHFRQEINNAQIKSFEEYSTMYNQKLGLVNQTTEYYCANNLVDALKLIGMDYMGTYNGRAEATTNYVLENKKLIISGSNNSTFDNFDPHDLWHDRLGMLVSRRSVNRPIDEGCAFLYAGSWGIPWKNIYAQFIEKVASDPNADWADYKENPHNFGKTRQEYLMVDYVVNALIVQKLENEKGFLAVLEFLKCGKYEKGNDNYYQALEKLTGVSKSGYNKMVWGLIENEG